MVSVTVAAQELLGAVHPAGGDIATPQVLVLTTPVGTSRLPLLLT